MHRGIGKLLVKVVSGIELGQDEVPDETTILNSANSDVRSHDYGNFNLTAS